MSAARPVRAAPQPDAPATPAVWDLCGLGHMPAPAGAPAALSIDAWQNLPAPLGTDASVQARAQVLAALREGGSRQRAAALIMEFWFAPDPAPWDAAAVQVAALARNERDPIVTGWALSMCERLPSACEGLDAHQWAQAEPDNAAAWIASNRRKARQRADIDLGLAQATRYSNHFGALAATLREAWPAGVPRYLQVPLLVEAIGLDSALASSLPSGYQHCKEPGPAAGPRGRACAALAEAMVQRGETLLDRMLGTVVGKAVGWPAERVAALRAENHALIQAVSVPSTMFDVQQPFSCESVERLRGWVDSVSRNGEVATLRAAMQAATAASAASVAR